MSGRSRAITMAIAAVISGAIGTSLWLAPQAAAHDTFVAPSLDQHGAGAFSGERADPGVARLVERVEAVKAAIEHHRSGDDHLAIAAATIGVSKATLVAALKDGKSIADVARAHGVSPGTVVDALVAHEKAEIQQKVADGLISQQKATYIESFLDERFTRFVNGTHFCRFRAGSFSTRRWFDRDRDHDGWHR